MTETATPPPPPKKDTDVPMTTPAGKNKAPSQKDNGNTSSSNPNEKVDRTALAEATIAEAKRALAISQNLDDPLVLESLLAAEKKCRLSNDALATKAVATCVASMCRERKEWKRLADNLNLLAKRRSQSKIVVAAILAEGIGAVEEKKTGANDAVGSSEIGDALETREMLLETILSLTEGRMHCELERAKTARMLATLKERDRNDVSAASDVLQLVNAETYGSLSKREKVDFILEQVRLLLAKDDRVRAYIVSKKVQRKTIQEEDLQDLKLRFYTLMIQYQAAEECAVEKGDDSDDLEPRGSGGGALELARHYYAMYETPCVKDDATKWQDALAGAALFLMLSDHASPDATDMTRRVLEADAERLDAIPPPPPSDNSEIQDEAVSSPSDSDDDRKGLFKRSLELFVKKELIVEPTPDQKALLSHPALSKHGKQALDRWTRLFHTRVVQHNIRVVAGYYKQITLPRLARLLRLAPDDAERRVSHMVSESGLYCKIDRPAGIARFAKPKPPEEILSDWAADINKMLNLVEMTCHLINKENMIHKI